MIRTIIPAAGRSSRLGRTKALLPIAGRPAIEQLQGVFEEVGSSTLVVIAEGEYALLKWCTRHKVPYALNTRPELGMLDSVRLGVAALPRGLSPTDVVMICPVDHATLAAETISTVARAALSGAAGVAVPIYRGARGHPLALRPEVLPRLADVSKEVGLRQILDWYPPSEVEVDDPGVARDIDRWSDWVQIDGSS